MPEAETRADRPDRKGLKTVVTYVHPDLAREIKIMAATQDLSIQEVGETALREWVERNRTKQTKTYGKIMSGSTSGAR